MRQNQLTKSKQVAGALVLSILCLCAAVSSQVPTKVDFRRDVQPILKQHCIDCHGPSLQMNGFRLDRRRNAMRGGTISVIAPGNSAGSRLYYKLIGTRYGPQMPPTGALPQEQINIIKAWIDQGAEWPDDASGDVPASSPDPKATRLMEALRDGDKNLFNTLLNKEPAAAKLKGPGGSTPLMQAVLYGDLNSVRILLEKGADPNVRNDNGATALMWAVSDPEKVRLLLDHGAEVNARSDDGRTPLLIGAGSLGSTATVKLLLDRGANPLVKSPGLVGDIAPVTEAARAGDNTRVRMLIDRGCDLKSAGFQPLVFASKAGCSDCIDAFVKAADRMVLSIAAVMSAPPLGDAVSIRPMIDGGADVNGRDPGGHTLLMLAASSDAIPTDTVRMLLDRGADLNAKDPDGRTALDFAKLRGATPIVEMLAKAGAKEGDKVATPTLTPRPARSTQEAAARSIPLLQKTDSMFIQKSGCVSCHNNTLTAMTIAAARKSRLPIDEQTARAQVKRIGAYLETWRDRALQGVGIPGDSDTISYILLGLAAENYPPDAATDAMARFIKSQQAPDGGWRVFAHRPPIESNDLQVTAVAIRVLRVYGMKALRSDYETAVQRATKWVMQSQPRSTEERAFQLLGLSWSGAASTNAAIRKGVRELIAQQRADGGWAQIATLPSDAYATGEALVALKEAGRLSIQDPVFKRGVEFLMKTQQSDGSWYVRSRAIPIQPYFESGFPYGHDQWISAAATNWATTALALASER